MPKDIVISKNVNNYARRINLLASRYKAENYLEIGVSAGATFFGVAMPHKVAVDPAFRFEPKDHEAPDCHFFTMTSDEFFAALASRAADESPLAFAGPDGKVVFDIIFIDGLHTFEQSFRDFENSLAYSHENTIWVIDDTVPCDPYSAVPDMDLSLALRKKAGLSKKPWHGDVFKTIFAIHDRYPDFSYCTVMDRGNPQTFLWHAAHKNRKQSFPSLKEISQLGYFDLLRHAALMMPVTESMLQDMVGQSLDPMEHSASNTWQSLIYAKILSSESLSQHCKRVSTGHLQFPRRVARKVITLGRGVSGTV